ncbi:MAG: hypothetical protein HZA89_06795 [Verrucomicrobia bacterium]|nr:hypothetical protein [Verrucomicrobiota bacterium]
MPKPSNEQKKLNATEQRNLDVEISFIEGVVRRAPEDIEALQILGDDYTRRGRFEEGLGVDETLAKLRPDDSLVHFNLACSLALTGQFERAIHSLNQALDLGYRDFKWLAKDPDLETLRKHPLYKQIRAKLRSLRDETR